MSLFMTGALAMAQIVAGGFFSCLVPTPTAIACWGSNEFGQLGSVSGHAVASPSVAMVIPEGIEQVEAGDYHVCALTKSGSVRCWGRGDRGQLGHGMRRDSAVPVTPVGLETGVSQIALGAQHSCALRVDGEILCWGANDAGQIGDGRRGVLHDVPLPKPLVEKPFVARRVVAGGAQSCAAVDGALWCWGEDNATGSSQPRPTRVGDLDADPVERGQLSAGEGHVCAVAKSGTVVCRGDGWFGQNGQRTLDSVGELQEVGGLTQARVVAAGRDHSCALDREGKVHCWGQNLHGQLGIGEEYAFFTPTRYLDTLGHRKARAMPVVGLPGPVDEIAVGGRHACARTGNDVYCWGQGWFGQLGHGLFEGSARPVKVTD